MSESDSEEIPENFEASLEGAREIRLLRGMSITQLSEHSGVTEDELKISESKIPMPIPYATALKVAYALHCDIKAYTRSLPAQTFEQQMSSFLDPKQKNPSPQLPHRVDHFFELTPKNENLPEWLRPTPTTSTQLSKANTANRHWITAGDQIRADFDTVRYELQSLMAILPGQQDPEILKALSEIEFETRSFLTELKLVCTMLEEYCVETGWLQGTSNQLNKLAIVNATAGPAATVLSALIAALAAVHIAS